MFTLSIIIPTYNMESLLPQCLDSVCVPDLTGRLQVIVVNDGSKDHSLQIATDYKSRFPDIVTIIDKQNGNYGSCINAALKIANGKYVKVLDADDSFDSDGLRFLVGKLDESDVDMVLTDHETINANNAKVRYSVMSCENKDLDDFMSARNFDFLPMHTCTYRTDLLRSMSYHQTEGISYTDSEWMFKPLFFAQTISAYNQLVYKYNLGRPGQTMSPAVMLRSMRHELILIKEFIKFRAANANAPKPNVKKFIDLTLRRKASLVYNQELLIASAEAFDASILHDLDEVLKSEASDIYTQVEHVDPRSMAVRYWRKHSKRLPKFVRSTMMFALNIYKKA